MYTKYGKSCRTKKPTQPPPKEKESISSESVEDALGEDPTEEGTSDQEGAGIDGESGYSIEGSAEGGDETGLEGESGGDSEGSSDEDGEIDEDDDDDDSGSEEQPKKPPVKVKRVMEYDIKDMYPEMNILIDKKKKEWDFQDPDVIRALWLESKTNVLSEWKVRNAKITKAKKPALEPRTNKVSEKRLEHLKNKEELQKALEEHEYEMGEVGRSPPVFESIQLATNLTTEMRYKYNRNNPPVPSNFVEHYEKYKKPPFKGISCHPIGGCQV